MTDLTPEERRRIEATILGRTATAATDALAPVISAMYADWLREGRLPDGWERETEYEIRKQQNTGRERTGIRSPWEEVRDE